jgi:hypothetical protein
VEKKGKVLDFPNGLNPRCFVKLFDMNRLQEPVVTLPSERDVHPCLSCRFCLRGGTRSLREKILASKLCVRVLKAAVFLAVISAILTRPALAAIRLGSIQLSQLAQSPRMLESAALAVFGIGFLALAFVVRCFQASTE